MGDIRLNRMIEQAKAQAEANYRQFRKGPLCDKEMLEAVFEECRVGLAELDDDGWSKLEVARTFQRILESKLPRQNKLARQKMPTAEGAREESLENHSQKTAPSNELPARNELPASFNNNLRNPSAAPLVRQRE